jgi:hypothetical protein
MQGPYLENHEIIQLNKLLTYAAKDTLSCWVATRINGASASMACDGNVSMELLKALDNQIMEYLETAKRNPYAEGMERVKTTPQPAAQKYLIGTRVKIADDLGPYMSHFRGAGKNATVEYTHGHAYGGDPKSYSLDIDGEGSSAWYCEAQLEPVGAKVLKPAVYDGIKHAKLVEHGVELNHTVSVYAGDGEIITENKEDE